MVLIDYDGQRRRMSVMADHWMREGETQKIQLVSCVRTAVALFLRSVFEAVKVYGNR